MDRSTFDLFTPDFWYTLSIGVLLLLPVTSPTLRKWVWAAVNVAFLGVLLGFPDLQYTRELVEQGQLAAAARALHETQWWTTDLAKVCGAVLAAYVVLQAVARRWLRPLPVLLGGLAVLALFLVRKLPPSAAVYRLGSLKEVLAAIGFSYVALRLVDVLRLVHEGAQPAPDLPSTVNYLLPFHMLVAGPIQGYADFAAQPAVPPRLRASDALRAFERIATGLFKKLVLAGIVATWLTAFRATWPYLAFEGLVFYLWLYLDFSAYSDISVGAGRLMGVATPENFNRPYVARNLVDFWNRWHMSLSQFIYRNIFIPVQMALARRTRPEAALWCAAVAFSVAFLLCGLWHALDVQWAAWGGLHAAGLVAVNAYRAWLKKRLTREAWDRYQAHRGIRLAATVLTQAYVAATIVVAFWPSNPGV